MHLLLADRLVCPRCGPPFGLILLADRVGERRIHDGRLGCPNCRDAFPVVAGFADLRAPPRPPLASPALPEAGGGEEALRLAALLGVAEGPGHVLLTGPVAAGATALAELIPDLEVAVSSPAARAWEERPGVSRMTTSPGLPFQDRSLRGVALSGDDAAALTAEAARVVAPLGRVVLFGGPPDAQGSIEAAGLTVVLAEGGVLVGQRTGPRTGSRGVSLPVV